MKVEKNLVLLLTIFLCVAITYILLRIRENFYYIDFAIFFLLLLGLLSQIAFNFDIKNENYYIMFSLIQFFCACIVFINNEIFKVGIFLLIISILLIHDIKKQKALNFPRDKSRVIFFISLPFILYFVMLFINLTLFKNIKGFSANVVYIYIIFFLSTLIYLAYKNLKNILSQISRKFLYFFMAILVLTIVFIIFTKCNFNYNSLFLLKYIFFSFIFTIYFNKEDIGIIVKNEKIRTKDKIFFLIVGTICGYVLVFNFLINIFE